MRQFNENSKKGKIRISMLSSLKYKTLQKTQKNFLYYTTKISKTYSGQKNLVKGKKNKNIL